jgi:GntR family transcriptional regulator/MocR family aminotransferase
MIYLERNQMLVTEIQEQLGDTVEIASAQAGMHLVCLLPAGVEDTIVWQQAAKAGVASWPLSICYQKKPQRGGLVLGYGGVDRKQMKDAVKKLAAVIRGASVLSHK